MVRIAPKPPASVAAPVAAPVDAPAAVPLYLPGGLAAPALAAQLPSMHEAESTFSTCETPPQTFPCLDDYTQLQLQQPQQLSQQPPFLLPSQLHAVLQPYQPPVAVAQRRARKLQKRRDVAVVDCLLFGRHSYHRYAMSTAAAGNTLIFNPVYGQPFTEQESLYFRLFRTKTASQL